MSPAKQLASSQLGEGEKNGQRIFGSNTVRRLRSQLLKLESKSHKEESAPKSGSNRTIRGSTQTKLAEDLAANGMSKDLMSIWKKVSGYEDSSPSPSPVKKSKFKVGEGDPSKSEDCRREIEANLSISKHVDSKDQDSSPEPRAKVFGRPPKNKTLKMMDRSANNLSILGKKKKEGFSLAEIVARRLGIGKSMTTPRNPGSYQKELGHSEHVTTKLSEVEDPIDHDPIDSLQQKQVNRGMSLHVLDEEINPEKKNVFQKQKTTTPHTSDYGKKSKEFRTVKVAGNANFNKILPMIIEPQSKLDLIETSRKPEIINTVASRPQTQNLLDSPGGGKRLITLAPQLLTSPFDARNFPTGSEFGSKPSITIVPSSFTVPSGLTSFMRPTHDGGNSGTRDGIFSDHTTLEIVNGAKHKNQLATIQDGSPTPGAEDEMPRFWKRMDPNIMTSNVVPVQDVNIMGLRRNSNDLPKISILRTSTRKSRKSRQLAHIPEQ